MTISTPHLHSEKYRIRDKLDISPTATQSCSNSRDEPVTIKVTSHDHDPVVPQQEGPKSKSWLSILIILVSISLSFNFVFQVHRALPSCFRGFLPAIPSFSDATAQAPSDTTSPAFSSNGRTDQVQWDNYTLILRGQRVLI